MSTTYPDGRGGSHPHARGRIAVGHVAGQAPLGQRQQVAFEWLEPSSGLDVHCQDCASEVTALLGAPACVAGTFAVRHSDGCPRLARLLARRAS